MSHNKYALHVLLTLEKIGQTERDGCQTETLGFPLDGASKIIKNLMTLQSTSATADTLPQHMPCYVYGIRGKISYYFNTPFPVLR